MDVAFAIVNIVFLLIFFFLITGQFLNRNATGIDLSETSELPLDQLPSPILVVGTDGTWELDGIPVAPEFLSVALAELPRPLKLHILIGRDAPADSLLRIVTRPDLAAVDFRLVTLRQGTRE
jgi:biopolymer transport protein ExbD